VAEIVDGAENERLAAWANENQAVLLNIQRQPGANVIEVVDRIKACCRASPTTCRPASMSRC
jgi:multidrug efflux pump